MIRQYWSDIAVGFLIVLPFFVPFIYREGFM